MQGRRGARGSCEGGPPGDGLSYRAYIYAASSSGGGGSSWGEEGKRGEPTGELPFGAGLGGVAYVIILDPSSAVWS